MGPMQEGTTLLNNFSTDTYAKTRFYIFSRTSHFNTYDSMQHSYRLLTLLGVMFLMASCGTWLTQKSETTAVKDLSDATLQAKFPGYTLTEYQAGEGLYQTQCSRCHTLYTPSQLTEEAWGNIIPKMSAKANKKSGSLVVTPAGEQAIFRYLYAHGMALTHSDH